MTTLTPTIDETLGQRFASFAVLDSETSNLPCNYFNKAGITELCIYGFDVKVINDAKNKKNTQETIPPAAAPLPKTPRVLHKLTILFNPRMPIQPQSEAISGLNNYMLEHTNHFDENAAKTFIGFVQHLKQPVCLVAHNGNNFDFPLVKQKLDKLKMHLPHGTLCLDSFLAFYGIDEHRKLQVSMSFPSASPKTVEEINQSAETEKATSISISQDQRILNETTPKRPTKTSSPPEIKRKLAKRLKSDSDMNEETEEVTLKTRRSLFSSSSNNEHNVTNVYKSFSSYSKPSNPKQFPPKGVYKLQNMYERVFGRPISQAHHAESDVAALMQLMQHYGVDFVAYAENHAMRFAEVPKLGASTNL